MTVEEIQAKLRALPDPIFADRKWPDYAVLGFGEKEVEDLLDLASAFYLSKEQSDEESSVSIHAWRSLGMLGLPSLLPDFLTLSIGCDDIADEWFVEDFGRLLGLLGMSVLKELVEAVYSTPEYPCLAHGMLEALPLMVKDATDRKRALGILMQLFDYEPFDRTDRALVLSSLVELKAVEEIGVIRELFAKNRVDLTVAGDCEAVEIALGLRKERETPEKDFLKEEARLADAERKERAGDFPEGGSLEEKLQYFLIRYGSSDSIRRVDQLDGFLLALSVSGQRMSNLERADCIWDPLEGSDECRPAFEGKREGQLWLECVREFAKKIERGMVDGSYEAHVSIWDDAEDSMDPEAPYFTPWLEGYVMGDLLFGLDFENRDSEEEKHFSLLVESVFEEEEAGIRLLEDWDENPMYPLMEAIQARFLRRGEAVSISQS